MGALLTFVAAVVLAWYFPWIGFGLGAVLCGINFYLSVLRHPLYRIRRLPEDSYRWVSGIPLLGSLFVAVSLISLHSMTAVLWIGIGLVAIDTGGIHWVIFALMYQYFRERKNG